MLILLKRGVFYKTYTFHGPSHNITHLYKIYPVIQKGLHYYFISRIHNAGSITTLVHSVFSECKITESFVIGFVKAQFGEIPETEAFEVTFYPVGVCNGIL